MASHDPGVARKDLLGRDGGEAVLGSESGGTRQRREGAPWGGGQAAGGAAEAVEASERARARRGVRSARCPADLCARARAHGHGAGSAPSAAASPRSPALRRAGLGRAWRSSWSPAALPGPRSCPRPRPEGRRFCSFLVYLLQYESGTRVSSVLFFFRFSQW